MRRFGLGFILFAAVLAAGFLVGTKLTTVQAQNGSTASIAAIAGEKGGQDVFGPYDVVKSWPKDIDTLPGNEHWTWGAGQSVYAESPNRIYLLFRGELPVVPRPKAKLLPEFGPSITFPIGRLPYRDATVAALPGAGGSGQDPEDGPKLWKGTV